MLIAYEDAVLGFQIKDVPVEEAKSPFHPISNKGEATRLQREASRRRPDIRWVIVGDGPFSVRQAIPTSKP
jgi:hypothetical protein